MERHLRLQNRTVDKADVGSPDCSAFSGSRGPFLQPLAECRIWKEARFKTVRLFFHQELCRNGNTFRIP